MAGAAKRGSNIDETAAVRTTLRALFDALLQRDGGGEPVFSEQELRHALPVIVLTLIQSAPDAAVPDATFAYLSQFLDSIGATPDDDADAVQAKVDAHYQAQPINPNIGKALTRALREGSLVGGASAVMEQLASVVGAEAASKKPVGSEPRPEGAIAAGPMARFAAAEKLVDKKRSRNS